MAQAGSGSVAGNHARPGEPATWPPHIRRRYGVDRARWRQRTLPFAILAVLLAPVGVWSLWRASDSAVSAGVGAYTITPQTVNVQLVYRTNADVTEGVTCAVRAQDTSRIDVGYAYIRAAATGGDSRTLLYTLRTRRQAAAVDVVGCQVGDDIDRLAGPQFPPGVKPPAQDPPGFAPVLGR